MTKLTETDWQNLLHDIHARRVLPVVGPGMILVPNGSGSEIPLYQYLAPRLAAQLELSNAPEFTTISAVAHKFFSDPYRKSRGKIYTQVSRLLRDLRLPVPKSLLDLASIDGFDLFIAGSVDSLLVQALKNQRPRFSEKTDVIRYHPAGCSKLEGSSRANCDLPTNLSDSLVYHLFGDAHTNLDCAIWEEDYIEFICGLIGHRDSLENLFRELKHRSLLLLGAPSDDWIVRFLLRVAKGRRLSDLRSRDGYLADRRETLGEPMVMFIDNAVQAVQYIESDPCEFVSELVGRWNQSYGENSSADDLLQSQPDVMPKGSVFISYSRDDEALTLQIAHALAKANVPVWIDRQRLNIGEDYERSLEHAVKHDASFFVSLISRSTEADATRYVHRERQWAAQKHVAGWVFYLPFVIDDTDINKVTQEPACFSKIHADVLSAQSLPRFVARVQRLVGEYRVSGTPRG